jgi:RNA polymerase sigma factor (sigma-70 family)
MAITPEESAVLVTRAARGDRQAWERLVEAYENLVWAIARRHKLSDNDASDVCQTVWLRLVEHIDRLSEPERVGAWLTTTTKRECLRVEAQSRRTLPVADHNGKRWCDDEEVDSDLLREETSREVRHALGRLPERYRRLLDLMMAEPPLSYKEIAAALRIPVGSIGPTRGRCLEKLKDLLHETGYYAGRGDGLLSLATRR